MPSLGRNLKAPTLSTLPEVQPSEILWVSALISFAVVVCPPYFINLLRSVNEDPDTQRLYSRLWNFGVSLFSNEIIKMKYLHIDT
jgi:hypothetical protein